MTTISNGESGLSVRNKINEIINKVEGVTAINNSIDVTGTVTAASGVIPIVYGGAGASQTFTLQSTSGNANNSKILIGNVVSSDNGGISLFSAGASTSTLRMRVSGTSGDISFYEDTGTTPKFFWDASAERLGIGTSSPSAAAHVVSSAGSVSSALFDTLGTNLFNQAAVVKIQSSLDPTVNTLSTHRLLDLDWAGDPSGVTGTYIRMLTGGTERYGLGLSSDKFVIHYGATPDIAMTIDSSGNVGIGTSSPTNLLDVNADSIRVRTAQTPATAGAAGNQGEIAWDADYIYVCVATDTWKRVAIATW